MGRLIFEEGIKRHFYNNNLSISRAIPANELSINKPVNLKDLTPKLELQWTAQTRSIDTNPKLDNQWKQLLKTKLPGEVRACELKGRLTENGCIFLSNSTFLVPLGDK